MDAKPASELLKYQTWFLKVPIHCEGCRRKVKKVLKSIDGVFTATIDPQQQKVTVTGSVGVEILLRKLARAGKHAEIWPESLDGDGKISGKGEKKKNKKNEAREPQSLESKGTENATAKRNSTENKSSNSNPGDNSPEKSPSGDQVPPEGGRSEGSGKKKKKKAQSGGNGNSCLSSESSRAPAHTGLQFQDLVGQEMGRVNVSPTRQQSLSYPESGYPPMVYVATYNRLYPMARVGGPSYHVPCSPYMCAGLGQDGYHFQSAPLVAFEIFSDENANGCCVM
ncbi:Heavy metal-associated isoprenylated plant protein 26 [Spatholobus suberectus]|nr:Heavy metal-associated isoprenylated plant protein 26 [Spatholobus suberectus]